MTSKDRTWNRAVEAVVRKLRKDWDDNGPWSKFISEMAAGKARSVKIKSSQGRKS